MDMKEICSASQRFQGRFPTLEQGRVCLLHWCWIILLISPSQKTYSNEEDILPQCPSNFIADIEQILSETMTFSSMSFSVETVAWQNETVL